MAEHDDKMHLLFKKKCTSFKTTNTGLITYSHKGEGQRHSVRTPIGFFISKTKLSNTTLQQVPTLISLVSHYQARSNAGIS